MDWFARNFIKAALTWFGLGVTLGVGMALQPAWAIYRPAHFHLNMLGFVAMMIYGVAYHVMPRFTGHPLHSRRLAYAHWWISNGGLVLLALGFALVPHAGRPGTVVLATGGVLSALGAYCFIVNIWRTLDGRRAPVAAAPDVVPVRRAAVGVGGGR